MLKSLARTVLFCLVAFIFLTNLSHGDEESATYRLFAKDERDIWMLLMEQLNKQGRLSDRHLLYLSEYFDSSNTAASLSQINDLRYGYIFNVARTELLKALKEGRIVLTADQKMLILVKINQKISQDLLSNQELAASHEWYVNGKVLRGMDPHKAEVIIRNVEHLFIPGYISGELNPLDYMRIDMAKNFVEFAPYIRSDFERDFAALWVAQNPDGSFVNDYKDISRQLGEKYPGYVTDIRIINSTVSYQVRGYFKIYKSGRFSAESLRLAENKKYLEDFFGKNPNIFLDWEQRALLLRSTEKSPGVVNTVPEIAKIVGQERETVNGFLHRATDRIIAYENLVRDAQKFVEIFELMKEEGLIKENQFKTFIILVKKTEDGRFIGREKAVEASGYSSANSLNRSLRLFFEAKKNKSIILKVFGSMENFNNAYTNVFGLSSAKMFRGPLGAVHGPKPGKANMILEEFVKPPSPLDMMKKRL